jgi:hypothetical protein
VGIGGAYLCIYGMEGPGGYQFVGRTLQVYNRFRSTRDFVPGTPWLLRFFDQIRFYPVEAKELLDLRARFLHGPGGDRDLCRVNFGCASTSSFWPKMPPASRPSSSASSRRSRRSGSVGRRAAQPTSGP